MGRRSVAPPRTSTTTTLMMRTTDAGTTVNQRSSRPPRYTASSLAISSHYMDASRKAAAQTISRITRGTATMPQPVAEASSQLPSFSENVAIGFDFE